jgi:hypothetical protein
VVLAETTNGKGARFEVTLRRGADESVRGDTPNDGDDVSGSTTHDAHAE